MTTRNKYLELEKYDDRPPYVALCRLCMWAEDFTSVRKARAAFRGHACIRELPDVPTEAAEGWHLRARCLPVDVDPEMFFEPGRYDDAIATCNFCPVRDSCLFEALREERRHIPWGIRGGLLPEERMALQDVSRG